MNRDEFYMRRCLELAEKGLGSVAPNPMVGCVIVYKDRIIGEGYHMAYGQAHAEVNAINSAREKELLTESTLYVNLEPCSHQGKTPPCTEHILRHNIPEVVIGCRDSHPLVNGQGIDTLTQSGIAVKKGILEKESREINRRFFTFHEKKRPYVILKWAQTSDGFMDKIRQDSERPLQISSAESLTLSHLWRSQEQAILVGTRTALADDPKLTVRAVRGKNPLRVVIDRHLKIGAPYHLLDRSVPTLVFTEKKNSSENNLEYHSLDFSRNILPQLLDALYRKNVCSVIVEGGEKLLSAFIAENLWDEARIITAPFSAGSGIQAPSMKIPGDAVQAESGKDILYTLRNI